MGTAQNARPSADGVLTLSEVCVSAQVTRVPVVDGHLACLSIELDRRVDPALAADALRAYQAPPASRDLPSAPRAGRVLLREEVDRPQPRLDRSAGRGMTTVVGRLALTPPSTSSWSSSRTTPSAAPPAAPSITPSSSSAPAAWPHPRPS